jgi:hypothetical protein
VRIIEASLPRVDVHQHLWSEPLVAALARRSRPPRVRSVRGGLRLDLTGEPPSQLAVDDPDARADGLDRALVALSCPLGIESLPPDEADPLLAAYAEGVAALPPALGAWGAIPLGGEPEPRGVDALLDEGFAGLCVPAAAIAGRDALERIGPVLERLEQRGKPLFVHPGPASAGGEAPWWPALTGYVSGLQAAWLAWVAYGRASHPRLRVLFAALAGLAPLHAERLAARGGPPGATDDPLTFYDTSSYGPLALGAMASAVGREQLVYGSDRPVAEPSTRADEDIAREAPARLLG